MRSQEAFSILLASLNRRFAMERPSRKHTQMNRQVQTSEQLTTATHTGTGASERDELAQSSFTAEEIAALFWLKGWYQSGGSDRLELVRCWEFLKWLVVTGKLEV